MTVGRLVDTAEQSRETFVRLRELSRRLGERLPALGPGLSMGMTDDYAVAVEDRRDSDRVGRALFGTRDQQLPNGKARPGGHNHHMDTSRRQLERSPVSARFAVRLMRARWHGPGRRCLG